MKVSSITSFGPFPERQSIVSSISRKFPILFPSGVDISVRTAVDFNPMDFAVSTSDFASIFASS